MKNARADYEVNVIDYLRMLEVILALSTLHLNMESSVVNVMQRHAAHSRIFGSYAEDPVRTSTLPHSVTATVRDLPPLSHIIHLIVSIA